MEDKKKIGEPEEKKWQIPSFSQWLFLFKSLSRKEKIILTSSLFAVWIIFASWGLNLYFRSTTSAPAQGGVYTEGLQGQPQYINPAIAQTNPVDSDLSYIIYSSLFKYDHEGKLAQDLAENWERSEDGLKYKVFLRKDALWHDGKPVTAEDTLFTLNIIRNPQYASTLRGNWEGIEVEKLDDYTLEFTLKKPYVPFLHNLTFGIMPKHLWNDVGSEQFTLTDLNKKPVGSGPYKFDRLEKDKMGKIKKVTLKANKEYYGDAPKLSQIAFNFYSNTNGAIEAYGQGEVQGVAHLEPEQAKNLSTEEGLQIYALPTTRIFAVFFNQTKSIEAANKDMRQALSYATDKAELVQGALQGQGRVVHNPLLPNMLGYNPEAGIREYNMEKAIKSIEDAGWKMMDNEDIEKLKDEDKEKAVKYRYNKKLDKFLELTMTVPNYPELLAAADTLKNQWKKVGLELKLEILDTSETIQSRIQDRDYEVLLFGEMLQADPDPTPFWHSSSKKAPGLNLALYSNDEVDKILDEARTEVNEEDRAKLYRKFQQLLDKEDPAIFLFSPYYLYAVSDNYQGIETAVIYTPSNRLNEIEKRHLQVTRVKK